MYDVIVAGAGPAGSYLSYRLSRKGYRVLNLEEHPEVGRPVECTGIVTDRVFDYVSSSAIANRVSGARIFFPNSQEIHVQKSEKTVVIYRDAFDKDVSAMASGSGADVRLNSRVVTARVNGKGAEVEFKHDGTRSTEKASMVIGADGANSTIRKSLYNEIPSRIVSTYQVDSAVRMDDQDSVSVYLGSSTSRGFFAWAVPTGDISRIGLGTLGGGARDLFGRLEKHFPSNRTLTVTGGPIPISYVRRTYGTRSLLVGDAAGIVKPLTGGGIYTGIVSSHFAANAVDEAFNAENFSADFLSRYEKYWKGKIGRELWIDGMVQKLFSRLSDSALNGIHRIISSDGVVDMINSVGDIDYPSRLVIRMLLRHPGVILNFFRSA